MLAITSTLLKAMTHPHSLTITSLGLSLLKGYDTLQILQNKAAKIILDNFAICNPLRPKLLILFARSHCILGNNSITVQQSSSVYGFIDFNFVRNNSIHNYNTRSRDEFHLPHVRTNWDKRFMYQSVIDWNCLKSGYP